MPAVKVSNDQIIKRVLYSLVHSCPILCNPMDCSTPGFPVLHYLLEFAQTHIHSIGNVIQLSHPLSSPSPSCLQSFPVSGSFPMSQFFASGGQSIGASASASILPMNTQDWSPLGWTVWISLQSKGLSSLLQHHYSKHQFFGTQSSLRSNSHIYTWLLKKP